MAEPSILIAGASGDLGARIAGALLTRGAKVGALVRAELTDDRKNSLARKGLTVVPADLRPPWQMSRSHRAELGRDTAPP